MPINNSNWSVLNNPTVNNLINKGAATTNLSQRYATFAQADKAIVDIGRRD